MNTGDFMDFNTYILENFTVLTELGVFEQVIFNTENFRFNLDSPLNSHVLDCLFEWRRTPEGYDYWVNISKKVPAHLKQGYDATRSEVYCGLLALYNSPQSYEYW